MAKPLCEGSVAVEHDGVVVCLKCAEPVNLPLGAMTGREWMTGSGAKPPQQWEAGLWGLDAGIRNAVRGGWTDEEILKEVRQLVKSYRQLVEEIE